MRALVSPFAMLAVGMLVLGTWAIHKASDDGEASRVKGQADQDIVEINQAISEIRTVKASWYAKGLRNPEAFTCASRCHERGTWLHVENTKNARRAWVKVNDFGPDPNDPLGATRELDLSHGAAHALGYCRDGEATLRILEVR